MAPRIWASLTIDRRELFWAAIMGCAGLVVGVMVVRNPDLPLIAMFVFVVVVLLSLLVSRLNRHRDATVRLSIMKWALGAFAIHFVIGMAIWLSPTLTTYFGGDALTYHYGATALSQHWEGTGAMPYLPAGKDGFYYMLAAIYYVFGDHAGPGLAIDAGFAAAMIPLLHDATDRHFGEAAARYVPPLCIVLPGFLIWGSQLLREAGIYLALAAGLNAMVRMSRKITFSAMSVLAASIVMAFVWRASVGALTAGGFLIAMILQNRTQNTAATVVIATIIGVAVVGFGIGHDGLTFLSHTNLNTVNMTRNASATEAASGFLPSSDISTGKHALFYVPLGLPLFMFGPMPWQVNPGRQLFGIPDAFAWWALIPILFWGFREAARRIGRSVAIYIAPAIANAIGLCLIIANFGTAVRERMQVILLLIPLVALGLSTRAARSNAREEIVHSDGFGAIRVMPGPDRRAPSRSSSRTRPASMPPSIRVRPTPVRPSSRARPASARAAPNRTSLPGRM